MLQLDKIIIEVVFLGLRVEVLERWLALEKWLNGQRQQPGRKQLREDKSRTARWRENPHKDKNTIKII